MKAATVPSGNSKAAGTFQSTPPVKAATGMLYLRYILNCISIHAAREGGDGIIGAIKLRRMEISIHAAREGGDTSADDSKSITGISIHAAREGGDGGIS